MVLRALLFIVMSLGLVGFGVVAWVSTHPDLPKVEQLAEPVVSKTTVLVAAHSINAGSLLKPEDLVSKDFPRGNVPDGATLDTPDGRGLLMGAMVRRSMGLGEVVMPVDVMRPGEHGFLAAVLMPGMRAVTLSVDSVSGTAGLIWPGDRVDLILLQTREDSTLPMGQRVGAETVLANVRVIAIDQRLVRGASPDGNGTANSGMGGNNNNSRTATLEVSPEQAERISVAAHIGKLSLTVRSAEQGPNDKVAGDGVTTNGGSTVTWASDVSPTLNPGKKQAETTVVHVYQGNGQGGEEFKF